MNEPAKLFRPRWLLGGIILGLILMGWLGRRAVRSDFHPNFTRFHPAISPEASYYPTVGEMAALVRARCRPEQVLVIVGGNSVLQGVWQPAELMWTRRLQELLGDRYVVINFALRGAMPADGGAVAAEALRTEFPRQIYLANEKPVTAISSLGSDAYRTIFWHAYFGGLLLPDATRETDVKFFLSHQVRWAESAELVGSAWLDRVFRYRDFWNRMAMEHLNTVPSLYTPAPPALLEPRKFLKDEELDGTSLTLERRYLPAARVREMEILRATSGLHYDRAPSGGWRLRDVDRDVVDRSYRDAFPATLHARTMFLVGRDSVFYRDQLTAEERARDEQAIDDSVAMFRARGYAAIDYGRGFTAEDYADRTHLSPPGGDKLAATVAPAVRALAEKLGYLK